VRTIYLIGFSGTGKSTIARLVGARLGLPVSDLDALIVARAGCPIADIFASAGEDAFRALETSVLREVAAGEPTIVATGGGVPTLAHNLAIMRETGWLIALEALPETLRDRLHAQLRAAGPREVRPLLDDPDPLGRIGALKAQRQAVYAQAHWTIHTDRLDTAQVADEVARAVALLHRTAGDHVDAAARGFRVGTRWFGRDRPVVCVPLVATNAADAVALATQAAPHQPDALELRADHLSERTPAAIATLLPRLAACGVPILFTNRADTEGGAQGGDEAERIATILAAIESGVPALVDLELATAPALRERVIAAGKRRGVPIILSSHDFAATPPDDELLARLAAMTEAGADAAKLALMPREAGDAVRLLALCRAATAPPAALPLAAMSMGPLGVITRVIGHRAGSALTFAALTAGGGSAPGQLTLAELRALWAAIGEPDLASSTNN